MLRRKIGKAQEGERQTGGGAAVRAKRHCKQIRTGKLPVRENEHGEIDGGGGAEEEGTWTGGRRAAVCLA